MTDPRIIPRSEWSDVHPTWTDLVLPTPKAILHHQGGTFTSSANLEDLKVRLRAIEHGEMTRGDGLIAIAYHWWVVNGGPFDGLIFECRPIGKQGGATYHQNAVSHAVCVSGNFQFDTLTPKAFASVCFLFAKMELTGFITRGAGVTPHSLYYATACPGVKLRSELPRINTEVQRLVQPIDWNAINAIYQWSLRVSNTPLRQGQRSPDVKIMVDLLILRGARISPSEVYDLRVAEAVRHFKSVRNWQALYGNVRGDVFGKFAAAAILK